MWKPPANLPINILKRPGSINGNTTLWRNETAVVPPSLNFSFGRDSMWSFWLPKITLYLCNPLVDTQTCLLALLTYVLTVVVIYTVMCLPQEAQVLEFGQKIITSVSHLIRIYLWAFVVGIQTPDRMTVPVLTKIVTVFIDRIEQKGV